MYWVNEIKLGKKIDSEDLHYLCKYRSCQWALCLQEIVLSVVPQVVSKLHAGYYRSCELFLQIYTTCGTKVMSDICPWWTILKQVLFCDNSAMRIY